MLRLAVVTAGAVALATMMVLLMVLFIPTIIWYVVDTICFTAIEIQRTTQNTLTNRKHCQNLQNHWHHPYHSFNSGWRVTSVDPTKVLRTEKDYSEGGL